MGTQWVDRDGVSASTVSIFEESAMRPCIVCGRRSGTMLAGVFAHGPCFETTTAASREQASATDGEAAPVLETVVQQTAQPEAIRSEPSARSHPPLEGAARRRQKTPAPPTGEFSAPAAVVDVDGIHLPGGAVVPLPEVLEHLGQLVDVIKPLRIGHRVSAGYAEPGQIWLTAELLDQLELGLATGTRAKPVAVADAVAALADRPAVARAVADGWELGVPGERSLRTWTKIRRIGEDVKQAPFLVFMPALADTASGVITDDDGNSYPPGQLATTLARFADAVGRPWRITHQTVGYGLLRLTRPELPEHPAEHPEPAQRQGNDGIEFVWSRPVTDEERERMPFLHAYDRGGAHAAACSSVILGRGEATHHPDGAAFNAKTPGMWRIETPPAGDWRYPHPLSPLQRAEPRIAVPGLSDDGAGGRPVWVSTPTLAYAIELEYQPHILEAWLWEDSGRLLEPWYKRLRDARTQLLDVAGDDPDSIAASGQAYQILKGVYTRSIGTFGSVKVPRDQAGRLMWHYRPGWRQAIVGTSRANLLRKIVKYGTATGRWPVAVVTDTVIYASDDPNPVTAFPGDPKDLGRGLGKFRPERSGRLAEHEKYLTGKGYQGKAKLTPASEWDPETERNR